MIILGIILVFAAWALPQILPSIPPGVDSVVGGLGWLLVVLGVVLLVLSFLGVGVGGVGPARNGRRFWY